MLEAVGDSGGLVTVVRWLVCALHFQGQGTDEIRYATSGRLSGTYSTQYSQ